MISKQYVTVLDDFALDDLIDHIKQHDVIAYDTETTGLNTRKDYIIGASFSGKPGVGFYLPTMKWDGTKLIKLPLYNRLPKVIKLLLNKKLVMQNASYDIRITRSNYSIDLLPALHADTQIMKHCIEEEPPFSLKEVAILKQEELGLDVAKAANEEQLELKANIVANGGSATQNNYELYKADMPIIAKYACADADLTIRLYEYWLKRLHEEDMYDFCFNQEAMPLYKHVTVPMEVNGIKLDMPKLLTAQKEISEDMEKLEEEIQAELAPYTATLEAKLLDKHCKVTTRGKLAQFVATEYDLQLPKTKSGALSTGAKALAKLDQTNEAVQFLSTGEIPSKEFAEKLTELRRKVYLEKTEQKYMLNIQSKSQMAEVFFGEIGEEVISRTPGGDPQFNADVVEELAKRHPIANTLHTYNKLMKIRNSYIERFIREHEDGYFYPAFLQHKTISGRYGSDFQQLNKPVEEEDMDDVHPLVYKYNNQVREFFISREGHVFIDADYESLEPHIFANDAGDQPLIDICEKGYDIYSTVAIAALGMTEYSADKKADNYFKKHKPALRQQAKAYALGIRYGMESFKLHKTIDVPIEEAEGIIENYFKEFPGLKAAMTKYFKQATETGKVVAPLGRVRHMPRAKELYKKYGPNLPKPLRTRALASKHHMTVDEMKSLRKEFTNLINNAYNFPIQSTAASIVNRAAIAISKKFQELQINGRIIANIHDQLVIEVVEEEAHQAMRIVQDCMENTSRLKYVTLKAPPALAHNMKEGH